MQATVDPIACPDASEAVDQMTKDVRAMINDVFCQGPSRLAIIRLDEPVATLNAITAEHHETFSHILPRILEHMVQ